METMRQLLAEVVGRENVTAEPATVASLLAKGPSGGELLACFPGSTEQVQEIVKLAAANGSAVHTTTDGRFLVDGDGRGGVLVDFRRMRGIERVDDRNLAVHIERGVTYGQLAQTLEGLNLKYLAPAAATCDSVVANAMNRAVTIQSVRFPDLQASNFKVVLADGQVQRTGSHTLGEEMADWKEDGGPYLSKWYYGSGDIYGIVTRATIWIYPNQEARLVKAAGFQERAAAMEVMKALSRMELLNEAIVVNRSEAERLFPPLAGQAYPWLFVYGFESFKEHVSYLERKADEDIRQAGGRSVQVPSDGLLRCVEGSPWFVSEDAWLGFYALYARVPGILDVLSGLLKGKRVDSVASPLRLVSFGSGRAVYCHLTLPGASDVRWTEKDYDRLLEAKAFFDRPLGAAAKAVYGRAEAYLAHLKKLKRVLDPAGLLNPGQPVDL